MQYIDQLDNVAFDMRIVSDATRIAAILSIKKESKNVGQLCESVASLLGREILQPAMSHHLAILRHSGFVRSVRRGKHSLYDLTDKGNRIAEFITKIN